MRIRLNPQTRTCEAFDSLSAASVFFLDLFFFRLQAGLHDQGPAFHVEEHLVEDRLQFVDAPLLI